MSIRLLFFQVLLSCISVSLFAQTFDNTFRTGLEWENSAAIYSMAKQDDGKIVIIGNSYFVNDQLHNGIYRLNADLTLDEAFNAQINKGTIYSNGIAFQSDGKIIIAGYIEEVNGEEVPYITRLNPDGSLDETFHFGTGFSSAVISLAVTQEDKIIANGYFHTYDGHAQMGIVRLNADGTFDETFDPGNGMFGSGTIGEVYVDENGKYLVTNENITQFNMESVPNVIRINTDGSLDSSTFKFPYDNTFKTHLIEPTIDNKYILAGHNKVEEGYRGIVRINQDGSIDETFVAEDSINNAYSMTSDSEGNVYIGDRYRVLKIQPDGKTAFTYELGTYSIPRSLVLANNGDLVVGTDSGLIILDSDGNPKENSNIYTRSPVVRDFIVEESGDILLAGDFSQYDGSAIKNIIRIDEDGNRKDDFNYFSDISVNQIEKTYDGKYLVCSNAYEEKLFRVNPDGSRDISFDLGTGFDRFINNIQPIKDGKCLVFGNFNSFNGVDVPYLIRLNEDGSLDETFNYEGNEEIGSFGKIHILDNREVIVGTSYDSVYVKKINGSGEFDSSFHFKFDGFANIISITSDSDNNIFICGDITEYGGGGPNVSTGIVKLSPEGTLDESFANFLPIDGQANDLKVLNDGRLLVGGEISDYNGNAVNNLFILNADGTFSESIPMDYPLNQYVQEVQVENGNIYLAGNFIQSYDPLSSGMVRFTTGISTPEQFTAETVSTSEIDLTWEDVSTTENGYIIERSDSEEGTFEQIADLSPDVTTFSDSELQENATYYYRAKAYNDFGDTYFTEVISGTTLERIPAIPENLVATSVATDQIDLSWEDVSDNETGFEIYRSLTETSDFEFIATTEEDVEAFSDTELSDGTTYFYKIRAINSRQSEFTAVSSATTVEIITGLDEKSDLSIYPNPFSDKVTISFDQQVDWHKVEIYNAVGLKVYEVSKTSSAKNHIDLTMTSFSSGIYTVKFTGADFAVSTKLIKE